jgi:hypothetical protein
MAKEPTLDELVLTYRKIRDTKQEKEAAHKEQMAELDNQLDAISARFLELFNTQNVESLRTTHGTVTRRSITRYWTSDWGSMYQFIKENDALHLLEQRIHSGHMKEFLEENPEALPIGLNADMRYAVTVRKPSTKGSNYE